MFGDETAVPPLAPIVTTPVPWVMTALVGLERFTLKLREGAAPDRSMMGTTMFCAVCPGAEGERAARGGVVGPGRRRTVGGGVVDGDGAGGRGPFGPAQEHRDHDVAGRVVATAFRAYSPGVAAAVPSPMMSTWVDGSMMVPFTASRG